MGVDIKQIGIFGLSFSRGFDQTWLNLWRKEDGYSLDLYQDVEAEDDETDDDPIDSAVKISFEEGEEMLRRVFEEGRIEEWAPAYSEDDEGMDTDLSWTLDIDDLQENDLLFSSGNGKLPPREMIMGALAAIRAFEPRFAMCFKALR